MGEDVGEEEVRFQYLIYCLEGVWFQNFIYCLRPFSTCYKHFYGCHGNIIKMLPWQPYKG